MDFSSSIYTRTGCTKRTTSGTPCYRASHAGVLCEYKADAKMRTKLDEQFQCRGCQNTRTLGDCAPTMIKSITQQRHLWTRVRCMQCQYPQCAGVDKLGCLAPDRVLYFPPPATLYHKGKYVCVACRFPPCVGCGASRPRRPASTEGQEGEYRPEHNVFQKPVWKCAQCEKGKYPRCAGVGGRKCLAPERILDHFPPQSMYHEGKYVCMTCRFPPCVGCGALRPQKCTSDGGKRYHTDYNIFSQPEWKCCRCNEKASRIQCAGACGEHPSPRSDTRLNEG